MRHGVSGQGSLEVSVSGWDNDIYHVRIVEVETVVVLTKVTVCDIHFIIKPIEEVCGYSFNHQGERAGPTHDHSLR